MKSRHVVMYLVSNLMKWSYLASHLPPARDTNCHCPVGKTKTVNSDQK
jgi:hypothetical protein